MRELFPTTVLIILAVASPNTPFGTTWQTLSNDATSILQTTTFLAWPDKPQYHIGETIILRVQPAPAFGVSLWFVITAPDGSQTKTLQLTPGRGWIDVYANTLLGPYRADLWAEVVAPNSTPQLVATCSYEIVEVVTGEVKYRGTIEWVGAPDHGVTVTQVLAGEISVGEQTFITIYGSGQTIGDILVGGQAEVLGECPICGTPSTQYQVNVHEFWHYVKAIGGPTPPTCSSPVGDIYPTPACALAPDGSQINRALLTSISEGQTISAQPGQSLSFSVGYQISQGNNPNETDQLMFIASWTPSWPPPSDYYLGIYNGIPPSPPGISGSASLQLTAPSGPGVYYLWFVFDANYGYDQAAGDFRSQLSTPAHIKITVQGGGVCTNPFSYPADVCIHKEIRLKQLDPGNPNRDVIINFWAKEVANGVFVDPNSLTSGKQYTLITYVHESNLDTCAGIGSVGCAHFESSYNSVVILAYTAAYGRGQGLRGDVKLYGKIGARYDMSDSRWVQLDPSKESTERMKVFMVVAGLTPAGPLTSYFDILGLINAYINRPISDEQTAMMRGFDENEFDYLVLPVYQYSGTTPYEFRAEVGFRCVGACNLNAYLAVDFSETVYPVGSHSGYYFVGKAFGISFGALGSALSAQLFGVLDAYFSNTPSQYTEDRVPTKEDVFRLLDEYFEEVKS